jgi:hypothetical protein
MRLREKMANRKSSRAPHTHIINALGLRYFCLQVRAAARLRRKLSAAAASAFAKHVNKNIYFSGLTITLDEVAESGVGAAGELLALERLADGVVVAEHHHQLVAEARAEDGAVLLDQLVEVQVDVALQEGQVAEHGDAPGAGRQAAQLAEELHQPHHQKCKDEHAQRAEKLLGLVESPSRPLVDKLTDQHLGALCVRLTRSRDETRLEVLFGIAA